MTHFAPSATVAASRSKPARHRALWLNGIFLAASIYSSAGRAELPVDNTVSRVETAARDHLARQAATAKLLEPLFEVNVVKTTRPLGACAQPTTIDALDTRQASRLRFVVICPGADGWRYEFVVKGAISARVAVLALPVAAGIPLAEADLVLERRDISSIADSLWETRSVAGLAARRSLRAGEVLRQGLLAMPAVIKRGDAVRIVARREQVEVSMAGEALDGGAPGAVIRVKNVASGNVIRARITNAGLVEPADLAPR